MQGEGYHQMERAETGVERASHHSAVFQLVQVKSDRQREAQVLAL